ncbi:hypothetical protein [Rugamonas rivuli]|uniref:Uncharacterized protein n=1 Tax=Rugamonas rivuli TaxID=2743358 RepID=A0A843S3S4_9BURK|nr:hypothetical protein [Rugamonas rivuli]MQA18779.1 hypothetical protein [Rugamonas rivuli]
MKRYKRLALFAFLAAMGGKADATPAMDDNSIAYRDSYVWYLANHMASSFLRPNSPEERAQFQFDVALLYHHALIDCTGPLDQIAAVLNYSFLSDKKGIQTVDTDDILFALGRTEEYIEPILGKWNQVVFPGILEKFSTGKVTTIFPTCMNPRYAVPPLAKPSVGS